jgi:6,7-dimethyl-8-ribityllumazine synthase
MASTGNSTIKKELPDQIAAGDIVVVRTTWNQEITNELYKGTQKVISSYPNLTLQEWIVPGAVEIPFLIQRHAKIYNPLAYIALGCIIKGDTPHFEYVCQSVTQGITTLNLTLPQPIIFGILTVDTLQQALERIGGVHGHKGEEAAWTALQMIQLSKRIQTSNSP